MTGADDAANEIGRRDRAARPFRIAALAVFVVALGLSTSFVVAVATLLALPLLIWLAVAADRARYRRDRDENVAARTGAIMRRAATGRRWIGVLSVERDGVRWTPETAVP